jgi:hypothetical protein
VKKAGLEDCVEMVEIKKEVVLIVQACHKEPPQKLLVGKKNRIGEADFTGSKAV